MPNKISRVLFLHGLNTYGDDDLHLGPLRFGSMHGPLVQGLQRRGIEIEALLKLGAGSPEILAERAVARYPDLFKEPVCLLGHSVGGLVARALASRPEVRARSVLTFGTPHFGAVPAEVALEAPRKSPRLTALLKRCGYDANAKAAYFEPYTREQLHVFNERFNALEGIPEISYICEVSKAQLSWPLRLSYRHLHPNGEPSDGFISSESQRRGVCEGPFHLDHIAAIGYFFAATPGQRRAAAREFERLLDAIAGRVGK